MAEMMLPKSEQGKLDAHIKMLHSELGITAAEEPQWTQFVQVMRDDAADMHNAMNARGAKLAKMSAADNMQSYADVANLHAANMSKLATAFGTLYATFPDNQKAKADAVFAAKKMKREHQKTQ